jgi:PAT family beta-lactamase induction signal transducer AmpG
MAVSNMGRASGSALLGVLKENYSWEIVFVFIAIMPLLMGIVLQFINFKNHKVKVDRFKVLDHTFVAPHIIDD